MIRRFPIGLSSFLLWCWKNAYQQSKITTVISLKFRMLSFPSAISPHFVCPTPVQYQLFLGLIYLQTPYCVLITHAPAFSTVNY